MLNDENKQKKTMSTHVNTLSPWSNSFKLKAINFENLEI